MKIYGTLKFRYHSQYILLRNVLFDLKKQDTCCCCAKRLGIKASLGKYICTCFSFYERITVEHARPTSRSGGGGGGGGGGGSGGGSGMRRGGGFRFRDRSVTHMLMVF